MDDTAHDTVLRAAKAKKGSPFLTTKEAAFFLGLKPHTLVKMRMQSRGPSCRHHGCYIFYHIDDLESWSKGAIPVKRTRELIIMAGATALMLLSTSETPLLIWNATASAPVGLYALMNEHKFKHDDLVLAIPPHIVQRLADQRRYLPLGVPLIKHVAALAGDRVCAETQIVTINGVFGAARLHTDSAGRSLSAWTGCRLLTANEVLLMNARVSRSFDGRYFGTTLTTSILGKLVPLWTR